ncbi:hypothetical protein [Streptomyces sp. NPDC059272]|uniref:hypothetical protein n=1 Tax=Streptomyces sp. NPDC059272 TaxID=3346800 RepID=UPI0036814598
MVGREAAKVAKSHKEGRGLRPLGRPALGCRGRPRRLPDAGWLMSLVSDDDGAAGELLVLDASDLSV